MAEMVIALAMSGMTFLAGVVAGYGYVLIGLTGGTRNSGVAQFTVISALF
jgi:hypothetical protein